MNHHTFSIYYDEEGDFLEVTFGVPPEREYADEVEEGIFITKDENTGEVRGIGILAFKKRPEILNKILNKVNMSLPIQVTPSV